ncbi:MAG: hypothetical protein WDA24_12080, partial [Tissierellales bacterium]
SIYCYVLYKVLFKNIVVMSFFSDNNIIEYYLVGNWLENLKFSISLEFIILIVTIVFSFFIGTIYSLKSITNK